MSPLRRLWAYFRPPPIASIDTLRVFLEQRAWLIAQKCAIDYCRGKTGLASFALFTEKPFLDALDVCQRESFAAVLGDLMLLAEGQLRAHAPAGQRPRLADALLDLYRSTLHSLPTPHRPEGWGETIEAFRARLEAVATAKPLQALDVADHSAKRMFDTLPIHISMRDLDEEVVYGAVRFRMIAVNAEMQQRFAPAELARSLTG